MSSVSFSINTTSVASLYSAYETNFAHQLNSKATPQNGINYSFIEHIHHYVSNALNSHFNLLLGLAGSLILKNSGILAIAGLSYLNGVEAKAAEITFDDEVELTPQAVPWYARASNTITVETKNVCKGLEVYVTNGQESLYSGPFKGHREWTGRALEVVIMNKDHHVTALLHVKTDNKEFDHSEISDCAKKAGGDVARQAKNAGKDIANTAKKAGGDVANTAKKAGGDIAREAKKFFKKL